MKKINSPPVIKFGHPLETKRYIVSTPPIDKMCSHVINIIKNRTPGGLIFAPPRTGKTQGIEILKMEISTAYKDLPIISLPAWEYSAPKQSAFMEDLLKAANHATPNKGSPEEKRDRLVELVAEMALEGQMKSVLLIIDEAQQLQEKHYKWLIGVSNLLGQRDATLITVLVGQQQLVHQRNAFLTAQKDNIVGRFMVRTFEFRGISCRNDVSEILSVYDVEQYPADSGWSFTRYYRAEEFDRGWRLKDESSGIWRCFENVRSLSKVKRRQLQDIPMEYFCRTVESILMSNSSLSELDEKNKEDSILSAIASSGYLDLLLLE